MLLLSASVTEHWPYLIKMKVLHRTSLCSLEAGLSWSNFTDTLNKHQETAAYHRGSQHTQNTPCQNHIHPTKSTCTSSYTVPHKTLSVKHVCSLIFCTVSPLNLCDLKLMFQPTAALITYLKKVNFQ